MLFELSATYSDDSGTISATGDEPVTLTASGWDAAANIALARGRRVVLSDLQVCRVHLSRDEDTGTVQAVHVTVTSRAPGDPWQRFYATLILA